MATPNANKRGAGWRARSEAIARAAARTKRLDEAQITRSDAELIAEAIAAGKLRRIPTGTSGLPEFEPSDNPKRAVRVLRRRVRSTPRSAPASPRTWSARSGWAVALGSTRCLQYHQSRKPTLLRR